MLGAKTNLQALEKALLELFPNEGKVVQHQWGLYLGNNIGFTKETGELVLPKRGVTVEQVKACYAKHVLIQNAQRAGWTLSKTNTNAMAERRY